MADPSAVTSALIGKLLGDSQLMALMPDGVYRDVAPQNSTRFVLVSNMFDERGYLFGGGTAFDDITYIVKAVERNTSGSNATAAASRIYALLQNGTLTVSGYYVMRIGLAEENAMIEATEADDDNPDMRWQHRGWRFAVMVGQ